MLFDSIRDALGKVRKEHNSLTKRRETLLQRRENLIHLAVTKEDFIDQLTKGIDTKRTEYIRRLQLATNEFNKRGSSISQSQNIRSLPIFAPWAGGAGQDTILALSLCALVGDNIKDSLSKIIGDLDWPKAGMPLAKREMEIKKIDTEISKLDAQLDKLKTDAIQSGVQLTGVGSG